MTICQTATEGEGCGLDFPEKANEGLCRRCTRLDKLDPFSDEYKSIVVRTSCLANKFTLI